MVEAVNPVAIVVLSHFPDLFEGFRADVDLYEPRVTKLLMRDGPLIHSYGLTPQWVVLGAPQPFNFSRNMNLAWQATAGWDVLIAGDDVRFSHPFILALRDVAYSDPTIGFAVPELGGQSCFVCAYVKRALIDDVGPMDEDFDAYGYQDNEYCRRFEARGWRVQPTTAVHVMHNGATSFHRKAAAGGESVQAQCDRMQRLYNQKVAK